MMFKEVVSHPFLNHRFSGDKLVILRIYRQCQKPMKGRKVGHKHTGKSYGCKRKAQNNQSPVPKIRVSHTQVTKQPQSKPNPKSRIYPRPGSTMNRTGTPRQPAPGRSLFLPGHGDRRGDPATLRGCDGSELDARYPMFQHMANHTA